MKLRNLVIAAAAAASMLAASCAKNTRADTTTGTTNTSQGGVSGAGSSASQTGSTMGAGNSAESTGARTGVGTPSDVGTLSDPMPPSEDRVGTAGSSDSMRSGSLPPENDEGDSATGFGTDTNIGRSTTRRNVDSSMADTETGTTTPTTGIGGSGTASKDGGSSFDAKDVTGGSGSDDRSGDW